MMKFSKNLLKLLMLCLFLTPVSLAEDEPDYSTQSRGTIETPMGQGLYIPRDVLSAYDKRTRSMDGRPGAQYWQNRASHSMKIEVRPPDRTVRGTQTIVYENSSPGPLPAIVFRLYLNAHHPLAMRERLKPKSFFSEGIQVDRFLVDGEDKEWDDPKNPLRSFNEPGSTIHAIKLDKALETGQSVEFTISWSYQLTEAAGWKEGVIDKNTFFLAYFFPRVTPFDDVNGWDLTPFTLSREFHNDFSDFDVEVTVPKDYVVWATGDLQNPGEVLQAPFAARLKQSFDSDKTLRISNPQDLATGKVTKQSETVTWKWKATNVPDFAIALSNHFAWDAASVVVDPKTGRRASVQSAYDAESKDFVSMVSYAQDALQWASTNYPGVPYPYSKMTVIRGGADEEYPMMANDSSNCGTPMLDAYPGFTKYVVSHEILHSWFPFYMGINENRYPMMDEGWTTAFEFLINTTDMGEEKAKSLFKAFRCPPSGWSTPNNGGDLPLINPYDTLFGQVTVSEYNPYGRPALAYLGLKGLLGDELFKKGIQEFVARWNGKHPLPWDMFNTFNDVAGRNLDWYFKSWFFSYNHIDLGINSVIKTEGGYSLRLQNLGGAAVPFELSLSFVDGTKQKVFRTPGVWENSPELVTINVSTKRLLERLVIETGIFVDANPENNSWDRS